MAQRNFRGIIDFVTDAGTAFSFTAQITSHKSSHTYRPISRRGRGTTAPKLRLGDFNASGTGAGKVQTGQPPLPNLPKYATGTLTRVFNLADDGSVRNGIAIPVRITNIVFDYEEGKDTVWRVSFAWQADGNPTITWNSTPVTFSAPPPNDQELRVGTSKTYDNNGIMTGAVQVIDVEGIVDTDAAEVTKLTAMFAAAVTPPQPNLKVGSLSFTKDEDDSTGGKVTIQWVLQDSKDNIETPRNTITTDPNDLNSEQTLAVVYTTGSPPSDPSLPSGLKLVSKIDQKINDQLSFRLYRWAKNDSKDDYQLPETWTVTDTYNILSAASVGTIDGVPSTPSGYVLRSSKTLTVKTGHTFTVNEFGLRTSKDDVEMPETFEFVDPFGLESKGQVTTVYKASDGVPADPSPYSGLQIVGSKIEQINTIESKKTWQQALVNPQQEREYAASFATRSAFSPYRIDVSSLINSTATDDAEAATQWATFQSVANAFELEVKTLTPNKKLLTKHYMNPGITVISTLFSEQRYVPATLDSGVVKVWVSQVITRGSGQYWVRVTRSLVSTPVRLITIRRLRTGTTVPDFSSLVNTTNNGSFLGLAAGTVYYRGATNATNISLASTFPCYIDYAFTYDKNGIFDFQGFVDGFFQTSANPTPQSYVDISTLTDSGFDSDVPTQSDFSVFLT